MSLRFLSPRAPWHKESVSEDAVRYDLQLRLKYALEKGDMDEVQACVEVRPRAFTKPAKWYRVFTPWVKKSSQRWISMGANAKDFVYDEHDLIHGEERFSLPIHCLCGSPGFDSHKAGILMYLLTTGFIEDDDLLVVDSSLNTPLHLCCTCALPETLRAILRRLPDGRGQGCRNIDGKTPVDLAVEAPSLSSLRLLSWTNLTGLEGKRERFDRVEDALHQQREDLRLAGKSKEKITYLGPWSMGTAAVVQENDDERILEMQRMTAELSLYCGLSSADADNLLKYHRFELNGAIEAFEADPIQALRDAGVSKIPKYLVEEARGREGKVSKGRDGKIQNRSDVRIEEGDARLLVCPSEGCRVGIPDQVVKLLVDEHTALQCEKIRAQNYVDVSKDVRWCPAPGCGRSVKLEPVNSAATTVRCSCGHEFCFSCLKDPHEPAKCGQLEEFDKAVKAQHSAEDEESEGWVESHTTKCIDCSAPILRSYGCNHMTCRQCGGEFCYMCGARWRPSHYTCMGADNTGDRRRSSLSTGSGDARGRFGQQSVNKLLSSRLRADCLRGFTQANEDSQEVVDAEQWGRLCEAVEIEPTLEALIEETVELCNPV
ncbi:ankyrin repeat and ibr domain containing protein, putative [Perkinsus marinus ATCC 50983]|uniref:RBR-type E3 ubiquitin transferase n=1 Tax=Perkinsus marinus (strain ATCC 50983 / TXsc) TaxID=423536 RepID=C5L3X7_PERM5|nr:ankyrin repeat and ibr domain containing protein, putative [Perkinsus marinus ATCC 50983]EER08706.1 ankyrin repeat and ibr domain containing protein, putative [Perkinsus marinus ATCC 50983]|eukprot:XP_002776890.1 ankyrin repeat and ibr domain containing protein, putative [Perkinsus marinus ATCC 50983]